MFILDELELELELVKIYIKPEHVRNKNLLNSEKKFIMSFFWKLGLLSLDPRANNCEPKTIGSETSSPSPDSSHL